MYCSKQRKAFFAFCKKCIDEERTYIVRKNFHESIILYGRKYGFLNNHGGVDSIQTARMILFLHTELQMKWFYTLKAGRTPIKRMFLPYTCTCYQFSEKQIRSLIELYPGNCAARTYPAIYIIIHLQTVGKCTWEHVINQLMEYDYNVFLAARWNESYIVQPKKR